MILLEYEEVLPNDSSVVKVLNILFSKIKTLVIPEYFQNDLQGESCDPSLKAIVKHRNYSSILGIEWKLKSNSVFNPFSTNVPHMQKPCSWFLLVK